ncbi:MAG: VanZ family protein [Candidatus Limnocylindria bacterium]
MLVTTRLIAGMLLAVWLAAGLALTLRPVQPLPGSVVVDNFIPFWTMAIYLANSGSPFWVGQAIGNLLLLLPLGLLGPIALPAMSGWLRVLLVALAASLAVEVAQLWIPNRSADVDDVVLNVVGAMIGYAIFRFLRLRSEGVTPVPERN